MSQITENHFAGAESITLVGPLFNSDIEAHTHIESPNAIFVDGGAQHRSAFKFNKSMSIGDGDSFAGKLDILVSPQKDDSDLSLALKYIPSSCRELKLYGFLGARSDHELAVMGELFSCMEMNQNIKTILCKHPTKSWHLFNKGQHSFIGAGLFSLFTLKEQYLSLTGDVSYKADQTLFKPFSSLGISNHLQGRLELTCEAATLLIQDTEVEK